MRRGLIYAWLVVDAGGSLQGKDSIDASSTASRAVWVQRRSIITLHGSQSGATDNGGEGVSGSGMGEAWSVMGHRRSGNPSDAAKGAPPLMSPAESSPSSCLWPTHPPACPNIWLPESKG